MRKGVAYYSGIAALALSSNVVMADGLVDSERQTDFSEFVLSDAIDIVVPVECSGVGYESGGVGRGVRGIHMMGATVALAYSGEPTIIVSQVIPASSFPSNGMLVYLAIDAFGKFGAAIFSSRRPRRRREEKPIREGRNFGSYLESVRE